MAVKSIQLGQVWRNDESGQDFLVTKVYSEVFTQFAVLRPADCQRARCADSAGKSQQEYRWRLAPGFTFTQEGSF